MTANISAVADAKLAVSRVLTFDLGGEIFAIRAESVREILEVPPVTRVPGAPEFHNGLINVRGAVVPLANLRFPFEMPDRACDEDTRVIVLEEMVDDSPEIIGIFADKVTDVYEMEMENIHQPPGIGMQWRPEFISGIGRKSGRFVIVPDMTRIFREYLPR
jgi:purine-binding chemotaxis protein CheW